MSTAAASLPLSGTQLQAVGALLAGRSLPDIARDCNIAPRTLRDWQRQPAFQSALREGQAQLIQQTCLQLATAAAAAVRTLVEICQDSNQKGSVRVAAANKLLDLAFRHAPQLPTSTAAAPDDFVPHATQTLPQQKLSRWPGDQPATTPSPVAAEPQPTRTPLTLPDHYLREFTPRAHPDTASPPQIRSSVTLLDRITTNTPGAPPANRSHVWRSERQQSPGACVLAGGWW